MAFWCIFGAATAGDYCSCERIAAVEAELSRLKHLHEAELDQLKRTVEALVHERRQAEPRSHAVQHEVGALADSTPAQQAPAPAQQAAAARRLQLVEGGKTYTATRSWHLHEFAAGHCARLEIEPRSLAPVWPLLMSRFRLFARAACASPGKAYLKPNMAAEGMTSSSTEITNSSTEFSLMSQVAGQSRSEIQRMAAPLKICLLYTSPSPRDS